MQTSPNCVSWQFSRKHIEEQSPSRKDGLSLRKENSQRRLALAFTQDVGCLLKMDQYTIATAFVYWQRFFMMQSLNKNDPYLIASACLLLAGKVEENFKSLQKITETSYYVRNKKDPKALETIKSTPKLLMAEMDKVVRGEEALLVTMNFDFFVGHPYKTICTLVKDFGFTDRQSERDRTFFQIAWNFANDSLRTTLCLQPFRPMDIAVACINLSANALNVLIPKAPDGGPWWSKCGVSPAVLQDVELQIMSLYKRRDGDSQTPTSCLSLRASPSINASASKKQRTDTPSPTSGVISEGLTLSAGHTELKFPGGEPGQKAGGGQLDAKLPGGQLDVKSTLKPSVLVSCGASAAAKAALSAQPTPSKPVLGEESSKTADPGAVDLELSDELMNRLEDVQVQKPKRPASFVA